VALADLGVHRVDRDGLYPDEQIARAGLRYGQLDVQEASGVVDREARAIRDGAHRRVLVVLAHSHPLNDSLVIGAGRW
jgi:hypothetical protein